MSTRTVSAACGVAIAVVAIVMDRSGLPKVSSQLFVLSLTAASGVVGVGALRQCFGKVWYWISVIVAALLHIYLLQMFKQVLPLPSTAFAFIIGAFEATVLCVLMLVIDERVRTS